MKENLYYKQSRLNNINNQKQKQRKNKRLIISVGVDVVPKTDDKICLKYYQTLWFYLFSLLCQRRHNM